MHALVCKLGSGISKLDCTSQVTTLPTEETSMSSVAADSAPVAPAVRATPHSVVLLPCLQHYSNHSFQQQKMKCRSGVLAQIQCKREKHLTMTQLPMIACTSLPLTGLA